jgi:hypothetical protein
MRLIRDSVPGLSERYIRYPMNQLVEAMQKCSPVRQAGEYSLKVNITEEDSQTTSTTVKPEIIWEVVEADKESGGDGGGSNSPSQACDLPGLLIRLLDQLTAIGETAMEIKKSLIVKQF